MARGEGVRQLGAQRRRARQGQPQPALGGGGAVGASAASTVKPSATIAACQCGSLPGA